MANDAKMVCTKLEIELGFTELPLTDRSHAIVIAKHSHFRIGIAGVTSFCISKFASASRGRTAHRVRVRAAK